MAHCTSSALNFFPSHFCNFMEYFYISSLNLFKECHKNLMFGGLFFCCYFFSSRCVTLSSKWKNTLFLSVAFT